MVDVADNPETAEDGDANQSPAERKARLRKNMALARAMWRVDTRGQEKEIRQQNWKATRKDRLGLARKIMKSLEKRGMTIQKPTE